MKTKISLFALAFIASTSFVFPYNDDEDDKGEGGGNEGPGIEHILSLSISPVSLSVNPGESLGVYFRADMGTVSIELKNKLGMTLSVKTMDTAFDNSAEFDIAGLPAGIYTLNVKNSEGNVIKSFIVTI